MVLQREIAVPVWGTTAPKTKVTVSIAGQTVRTKSDDSGAWKAVLEPLEAGGPHTLAIKARRSKAIINDVLVGDVWVCSGQSNMQWTVKGSKDPDTEIQNANHPYIRLFSVRRTVSGEPLAGCEGEWDVCSPSTVGEFSAVGYYFGRSVAQTLKVPVGLINTSWGGTPAEAWTSRPSLEANPDCAMIVKRWDDTLAAFPAADAEYEKNLAEWTKAAEAAKAAGQPEPKKPGAPQGPDNPWRAAGLYNGMIAPLIPYGIKGAIWYQGEANAPRAYQYRSLLPTMITDWRKNWGQGDFPFFFVQLANFMDYNDDPNTPSPWAELREAQLRTLGLKNTGMATIIDIGEAKDIHPKNKQDVGLRLALSAFKTAYGHDWPDQGPMYKSLRVDGNKAVVTFADTDGGLKNNNGSGPLRGFAVAGDDKVFHWADATIAGDDVTLTSPNVAKPVAVRYGWGDNPCCDLYNGFGLPTSPFRTDDWPGTTVDAR
ncbi:MAG: sialate O-acetylesterase [Candidatus Hydrogenedentes bacterium]|nr:sialate O-acetylesterase [Candidatus Hydrogenedentota bacterium]